MRAELRRAGSDTGRDRAVMLFRFREGALSGGYVVEEGEFHDKDYIL